MVSKIWGYFIIIGIVYSLIFGDVISLNKIILGYFKHKLNSDDEVLITGIIHNIRIN